MVRTGRGWGKTRTGAEFIRAEVEAGRARWIALVAASAADARDVMVEGESGILRISPPSCRPTYEPSKRRVTWPNGAQATMFSAAEYDQLRGPQCDTAWCDELAKWKYPDEAWDNLIYGLRLGDNPRVVITTTPRPIALIKRLRKDPACVETIGATHENRANVPAAFLNEIISRHEGTRLGRQEIHAEILEDVEGALWTLTLIDKLRVEQVPEMYRIVVAIDPAVSVGEDSSETGIVVCGLAATGQAYVLEDLSGRFLPIQWATIATQAYARYGADAIIGEGNNGGDMVEHTIRTVSPHVHFRLVHASKGKYTRAEPVSALYERGLVHHVGAFPALEDQMTTWVPGEKSPDRMDALVWALTDLVIQPEPKATRMVYYDPVRISPI